MAAAVILEQHGYPPLLLDLESWDLLDHVIFVFQRKGLWGSIARSRDIGLHGRKPIYKNLRQLVWSYFEPYVDLTGRIKGYGLTSLYELGNYDWRFNKKNMHKIEDHLRAIPHRTLRSSDARYERLHETYKAFRNVSRINPPCITAIGMSGCFESGQKSEVRGQKSECDAEH